MNQQGQGYFLKDWTNSGSWNNEYISGVDYRPLSYVEYELYKNLSASKQTVLDIGCGTGLLARELFHLGHDVVGIDFAEAAISIAKSRTKRNIRYVCDNFAAFNPKGKAFSLVVARLVWAFISNKSDFLDKLRGLMSANSHFVLTIVDIKHVQSEKEHIASNIQDTIYTLKTLFSRVDTIRDGHIVHLICSGLN